MAPALLVLAAGLGSRYGGLKQIEPVGPSGETLLDYAVYDALRAGFGHVVFLIRKDFDAVFREKIGSKYAGKAVVAYAYQELAGLPAGHVPPAGRAKPWGTGHAVWSARGALDGNFAAINADDFYGADAFRRLFAFLSATEIPAPGAQRFALAGFRLADASPPALLMRLAPRPWGPEWCRARSISSRRICTAARRKKSRDEGG